MWFYLLALLIAALDQLIKFMIVSSMHPGQVIQVFGFVKLAYVQNTGAAFSLFSGFSPYLMLIGVAIILAVVYFHYRVPANNYLIQTGMAFILGGSLGNLADRILRSYVIDYIDLTFWPVFNLADVMINLGVLLIIIRIFIKEKKDAPHSV